MTLLCVFLSTPLSLRSTAVSQSGTGVVQTPVSRKSHSSVFNSQVTLNNVEVCSENISTLKKTLEVWRTLPVSCSLSGPACAGRAVYWFWWGLCVPWHRASLPSEHQRGFARDQPTSWKIRIQISTSSKYWACDLRQVP